MITHRMWGLCCKLIRCRFINSFFMTEIINKFDFSFIHTILIFWKVQYFILLLIIAIVIFIIRVLRQGLYGFIYNCRISIRKFWCIYFNIVRRRTWGGSIFLLIWTILFIKWESSLSSMKKNLIIIMTISVDYLTTILAFSIWNLHRILFWIY